METDNANGRFEAMERWKAARLQFEEALRIFANASTALRQDSRRPSTDYLDYVELQANLRTLVTEIPLLRAATDNKLSETYSALQGTVRDSQSILPFKEPSINKVPAEILSCIFTVLARWDNFDVNRQGIPRRHLKGWSSHVVTLSGVNLIWRRVAVTTTAFWSRVDIFLDRKGWYLSQPGYTDMCLQRIGNAPIDLYMSSSLSNNEDPPSNREITTLPECLLDRPISSLNVSIQTSRRQMLEPILIAWQIGTHPVRDLTSLEINIHPLHRTSPEPQLLPEYLHRQIGPKLHTLRLKQVHLNWNWVSFSELVDLQLDGIPLNYCPLLEDLQRILTSCSRLRIFSLSNMRIRSRYHRPLEEIAPIELLNLQYLTLCDVDTATLAFLFQLIKPGNKLAATQVRYARATDPEMLDADFDPEYTLIFTTQDVLDVIKLVGAFCSKYKPPTLCLHFPTFIVRGLNDQLYELIGSLDHLHTLDLGGFFLDGKFPELFSTDPETSNQSGPISLRTNIKRLRLHECVVTLSHLHHIISSYSFLWLGLDGCKFQFQDVPSRHGRTREIMDPPDAFSKWVDSINPRIYIGYSVGWDAEQHSKIMGLTWWLP